MGRTENQKLKLLYLKELFERQSDEEHLLSMQDILDALAARGIRAERKSVYDDLGTLNEMPDFPYEIMQKRGRGGGYYMTDAPFELAELKLLVDERDLVPQRSRRSRRHSRLSRNLTSICSVRAYIMKFTKS